MSRKAAAGAVVVAALGLWAFFRGVRGQREAAEPIFTSRDAEPVVIGRDESVRSGLDLLRPAEGSRAVGAPASKAPEAVPPRARAPEPEAVPEAEAPADPRSLARRSESAIRALAERYTREHPLIRQYGKEWMSYPDLKKLNDDYMRDRDPIRFVKGLSGSDNFRAMMRKYIAQPAVQAFLREAVVSAPPEATIAATEYLRNDPQAGELLSGIAGVAQAKPGEPAAAADDPRKRARLKPVQFRRPGGSLEP